jgi:hypothetical protein
MDKIFYLSGQPFPLLTPFFTYQLANHHTQKKKLSASVWPHPKFQKSTYLSALVLEALHDNRITDTKDFFGMAPVSRQDFYLQLHC